MKYLFGAVVLAWLLAYSAYRQAMKAPCDDFGAGVWVWLMGGLASILTAALFIWALIRGLT